MSADGDSTAGQLPMPHHDAPERLLDANPMCSSAENISLSASAHDASTSAVDSGLPEQHAAQVPNASQGAEWPVFEDIADNNVFPSLGDAAENRLPNGVSGLSSHMAQLDLKDSKGNHEESQIAFSDGNDAFGVDQLGIGDAAQGGPSVPVTQSESKSSVPAHDNVPVSESSSHE